MAAMFFSRERRIFTRASTSATDLRIALLTCSAVLLAACSSTPAAAPGSSSPNSAAAGAASQAAASSAPAQAKPSAAPSGLKKVRFGDVSKTTNSWPEFIADTKGFFAREGIQLEVSYLNSAVTVVQAAAGGAIDVGSTGYQDAISGIQGGAPLSIVSTPMLKYAYSIMSDPKVKTAADMKGKSATMSSAKQGNDLIFRKWLKDNNVDASTVKVIYIGSTPDRFAALKSGQVQAAALSQPFDFRAADDGYYQLVDFGKYLGDNFAFLAHVLPKQWIKDNPDTVRHFLKAYSDGIDYFYDPKNKDEVISILDKAVGQDHAIDVKTYEYYIDLQPYPRKLATPLSAVQGSIDTMLEPAGPLPSPAPPASKFLDLAYLPQ